MHRIVQAHLNAFVKSWNLAAEDEATQFEMFANYAVISARFSGSYELDDVTTGNSDDGMDGIAVVIDEEISVSLEDAEKTFESQKRNHDVDIIFIQSKRSDGFDLGDFLKFKESVFRFIRLVAKVCGLFRPPVRGTGPICRAFQNGMNPASMFTSPAMIDVLV